jgi:hypothetical protein
LLAVVLAGLLGIGLHLAWSSEPTLRVAAAPTVEPALIGSWDGQGGRQVPEFFVPGGTYEFGWSMSGTESLPTDESRRFSVSLFDYDFPHSQLGVAPKDVLDVVDFVGLPGRQRSFSDKVRLPLIPAGRYYLEVETCQRCEWQLEVWQQGGL